MSHCLTQKEPVRYTNKLIKRQQIQNYREYLQLTKNLILANITINDKRGQERKVALKVDSMGEWTTMSGKLFQVHTALKQNVKRYTC